METKPCWQEEGTCTNSDCTFYITFPESRNCSRRVHRTLTKAETARALGVCRARVGQLEAVALAKVRTRLRRSFGITSIAQCVLPTDAQSIPQQFEATSMFRGGA